jgi:D-alanyl-D-alanine carboxypeptidase
MSFIICTLNAPDDWNDHKSLYEYAAKKYERRRVMENGQTLKKVLIDGAEVSVVSGADVELTLKKASRFEGRVSISVDSSVSLPVKKGDKIGICRLYCQDTLAAEFDAVCGEDADKPKKSVLSLIRRLFGK